MKFALKYDMVNGLLLPIEIHKDSISWFSWENLVWKKKKEGYLVKVKSFILFETDKHKILTQEYSFLLFGIVKYNAITSANFRPFMKLNQSNTKGKYFLDIGTNWMSNKKASYFLETHVFLELTDSNGYVRSVGQDIFEHTRNPPKYGLFRASSGSIIIRTPDVASFLYTHFDRTIKKIRMEISKKEHDKIVTLVESDKYNHQRTAELLKGNCTSYVSRILMLGLNYFIQTEAYGFEILSREISSQKIDNCIAWFSGKLVKKPKWLQIAVFCFPPIYFISFILGSIILITSSFGFKNHREYSVLDLLFKPWNIKCDIPFVMYEVLNKHADEKGEIDRNKYPSGTIFD